MPDAVIVGVGGVPGHDSNACVLVNGQLVAASQEERYTRLKHDDVFPSRAIADCLALAGCRGADVGAVVFAAKPFQEWLATYTDRPSNWLTLQLGRLIPESRFTYLREARELMPRASVHFAWHHACHASFAFAASPFDRAAFLCVDGRGDDVNATIGIVSRDATAIQHELPYNNGVGMFYSLITAFLGFAPLCEYKVMGLAPYGEPILADRLRAFVETDANGALRFNRSRASMTELLARLARHLGVAPRSADDEFSVDHLNLAASVQRLFEEEIIAMARYARDVTGEHQFIFCGGCAQNCVAAARLRAAGIFDAVFVAPAAGDMGIGVGAALIHDQTTGGAARGKVDLHGLMLGSPVGPVPSEARPYQVPFRGDVLDTAATLLASGAILGWVRGRMEFGARALGARSILADPRSPDMQATLNQRIKFRESFRPFAPAVLAEDAGTWFMPADRSDYMQTIAWLRDEHRRPAAAATTSWRERLAHHRCAVPAVVHVDFTSRLQTVDEEQCRDLHRLLTRFKHLTGIPMLVNTSFNVAGEPIVRTAADAWRCFAQTRMDYLLIEDELFRQPRAAHDRGAA